MNGSDAIAAIIAEAETFLRDAPQARGAFATYSEAVARLDDSAADVPPPLRRPTGRGSMEARLRACGWRFDAVPRAAGRIPGSGRPMLNWWNPQWVAIPPPVLAEPARRFPHRRAALWWALAGC